MTNIILYGVSGSGKSTLVNILGNEDEISIHRKDSRRELKPKENPDSNDLRLIGEAEFKRNASNGLYTVTYGKYGSSYGVVESQVKDAELKDESHLIIIRDIEAIKRFRERFPNSQSVYVHTDPDHISKRLIEREGIQLEERLRRIEEEYQEFVDNNTSFDYVVLNFDDISNAHRQLKNIIDMHKSSK